ncbi:fungal-specific transcription factor domain-containing protein [Hypoxylon rubiginosum]|uniref:Fungal-specific transcription factor domain-containing protein n=1 Tax=Hypoxylon rubiginosum TaxID=110542 RepID=A0ACB9Z740_9PEZI|nr:fungal-specific transcription factor domain-containing protein [Hypoxylon rubiginosum]
MVASTLEGKKPSKMRPPMRSSVACTRCRKSKIKCENHGGTAPCDSCVKTGKDCQFAKPDPPPPPKRTDPPTGVRQERDGGSDRKKLKKIDDISKGDNQKASEYADEVLSASFLTEDLWEQVLDIYKLNFAPELPFLHLPTMKEKLGRKFKSSQPDNSSEFNLVLLGVLTLTARLHPDLVKYLAHVCNNQPGNARTRPVQTQFDPAAASEYYADILTMALGPLRTAMKVASVERVAALLMLGLYEWSQTGPKTGGLGAWMYVGIAIRMAQYLRLGFGDISETEDVHTKSAELQRRGSFHQSQVALDKEIRRRTMFSCFILDRMLACGKERVPIVNPEDLQIQLPCSEDKFDLAMEVPTGFLRDRARHGLDDSVLSRFIQLVDIWGEISRFSSEGGRVNSREKDCPPWSTKSTFYQLDKKLREFDAELPGTFTFSRSNYFKHENHQASSVFVLLHMLRGLCLIMLHREYIPFVPIRCEKPQGPLDEPTFPTSPDGFWVSSAEQVFKASREIVDLVEICQRKKKLPQSTIVLFAIWTAAFCGLYAKHFPQMDTERHMLNYDFEDAEQDESVSEVFRRGSVAFAYNTLHGMSMCQKLASTYVRLLRQMDKYFDTIKQDYFRFNAKANKAGEVAFRVREGGISGGLEEYKPMSKQLKDFGNLQPEDHDNADGSDRSSPNAIDHRPPSGAGAFPASTVNSSSKSAQPGSFTAINRAPITPAPESGHRPFSNGGGYPTPHPEVVYPGTWAYHVNAHQQQLQPPPQVYSASEAMLDPTSIAAEADNRAFDDTFKKEQSRRIGTIGDLGYFSSGDPQVTIADMPFGDASYIPTLGDPSYYLHIGEY